MNTALSTINARLRILPVATTCECRDDQGQGNLADFQPPREMPCALSRICLGPAGLGPVPDRRGQSGWKTSPDGRMSAICLTLELHRLLPRLGGQAATPRQIGGRERWADSRHRAGLRSSPLQRWLPLY